MSEKTYRGLGGLPDLDPADKKVRVRNDVLAKMGIYLFSCGAMNGRAYPPDDGAKGSKDNVWLHGCDEGVLEALVQQNGQQKGQQVWDTFLKACEACIKNGTHKPLPGGRIERPTRSVRDTNSGNWNNVRITSALWDFLHSKCLKPREELAESQGQATPKTEEEAEAILNKAGAATPAEF